MERALDDLRPYDEKDVPDSMHGWFVKFREVLISDQKYRQSPDMYFKNLAAQNRIDSANEKTVLDFVSQYGYPENNQVGSTGKLAIHYVMLHATIPTKTKFYPYLIEGYKKGRATSIDLCMFEDKLNVDLRRRQYYGTQVIINPGRPPILFPLVNFDSLDRFRVENGLDSIADYFRELKMEWNPEVYKSKVDSLEKNLKITDPTPIRFVMSPTIWRF